MSRLLLRSWHIPDFSDGFWGMSYNAYKRVVTQRLLDVCAHRDMQAKAGHYIPLSHLALCSDGPCALVEVLRVNTSWGNLVALRSWTRFRAGLLLLSRKGGRRSRASVQCCIFRGAFAGAPYQHVIVYCPVWGEYRTKAVEAFRNLPVRAVERLQRLLTVLPGEEGFSKIVEWSGVIDTSRRQFWRDHGVTPIF